MAARKPKNQQHQNKLSITDHTLRNLPHSEITHGMTGADLTVPEAKQPEIGHAPQLLQQLQAALEESRDRYLDLFTFAPVGYLTITSEGLIAEINLIGLNMLMGTNQDSVMRRPFAGFVIPEDSVRYLRMTDQAMQDGRRNSCALGLRRCDGSILHTQLDCVREHNGHTSPSLRMTVTDLTERKRMESEIEKLAFFDPLTRLPNRRRLMYRLQQATSACVETKQHGAVLIIDLDDFKTLNDTQGHDAGDQLLQQVAQRLSGCVNDRDTVCRLGGDEFVVMLERLGGTRDEAVSRVNEVGKRILEALNAVHVFGTEEYRSSGSVGATLFSENLEGVAELLKRADLALYRAKASGGGVLAFFEEEMQIAVTARAMLEMHLRHGLQEKQFVLYYQPQVDSEGRLLGAEALMRWHHPGRGLLLPNDFISLAEEKGFIISLGQWALETACRQLVAWGEDPKTTELTVSVNVSAHEFRHPKFVERTWEIVERTGANAANLMLEFTEGSLLGSTEDTVSKIQILRGHGIRFSLDDFGIGYSSLTYLKNLPLDQIKIDRSFIGNVVSSSKDAAIVASIITLGSSLGLTVVAEGVETFEHRNYLLGQGCRAFQGYLFGRPVPIEQWPNMDE